ncbi:EAL domain-containing protein [Pseudoduganella sp. DS3]|uniref:EAL domain-containing protein n=1 Tax=Pseudoduganella guangdongensis TaxID=2692179 RepID=A0A6N9HIS0_9BURK|nr:EAL domain-containing protein [Pseudoduganella guangdongensis]MYN02685.1 EAL domain-containing protein [Pseudoduganella guangdongensis]
MDDSNSAAPQQLFRTRTAALALLCGFAMTGALFAGVSRLEAQRAQLAFEQRVQARAFVLREGVGGALASLHAVNQLFVSHPATSREEFRRFVAPLLARYPYVLGTSYLRFIEHAERPAFEASLQALRPGAGITDLRDGLPQPAPARPRYRVIDYIEPLSGNEAALGFDTLHAGQDESGRRRAYASGAPGAGRLVPLVQRDGAGPRQGVVVSMPLYAGGVPGGPVVGETALTLLPGEMIEKIFSNATAPGAFALQVYAAPDADPAALVYQVPAATGNGGLALPAWLYPARPAPVSLPLDVAGARWLLVATPPPRVLASEHLASLFTLALGVLTTLIGSAFVDSLKRRKLLIQQRVDTRTAELKAANQALLLRQRAIESSTNAVVITSCDLHNPIVYVNPAYERITGYSSAEVLGTSPRLLFGQDLDQPGIDELRSAIREQRDGHAVLRCYRKDGSQFWNDIYMSPVRDEQGAVTNFISIQHDITAIKAYESELHHQSTHDSLTGLPNRVLLQDRLAQTIQHSGRKGHELWLVSIDLDRFKFTNSRLGHKGGDRLLQIVAARLQAAVRPVDTVARLGGDEFALLLLPEHGGTAPRAEQLRRVLDSLAAPLVLDNTELFLTCSAGIAVFPSDSKEPGVLAERADIAMFRAKEMGGNNYRFYTASMNEQLGERLRIESALRTALERREFELHYQPQVDTASGRIMGMEALIRWRHPEMGMVAPNRFIPLAEETGQILAVGHWVLRTACRQLRDWQGQGRRDLRMAVNVSARQLAEPDFVQDVADVLADTGLAPHCLELELTESAVMNDVEHATQVMHALKKLGIKLAIDDFGTGYSSLAHLKRFEIDVLKIDQTFVRDLTVDPDDAAIVCTIIALAGNLGLEVISEGVETQEQIDFLRRHGCCHMQGYFFGRPLPAEGFLALLEQNEAGALNA